MGKSTRKARVETRFILSYPIVRALSPMRIIRRDRARASARFGINFQHKKVQQHGERSARRGSFASRRSSAHAIEISNAKPLAFSPGSYVLLDSGSRQRRHRIDKDRKPERVARGEIINRPARNLGNLGKRRSEFRSVCRRRSTNGRTRE